MYNVDTNLTLTKKKRRKRKKKNTSLIPSQPVVSPVNTIAALFKLQQKLTNKNTAAHFSSTISQDKPLMSGPRFRPHMKWINPALNCATNIGPKFPAPKSTTHQQVKNDIPNTQENIKTSINQQSSESDPSSQIHQSSTSKIVSDNNKTKYPQKRNFQSNKMYKMNINPNVKFDECEIYDSPSFINFESDEGVTDLNDDDICNTTIGITMASDKLSINKPDTQISFETKLQQQHAKKLESRNQGTTNSKHNEGITEDTKNSPAPSLVQKPANQEPIEELSSDIKTVVRDNIKTPNQGQNKQQLSEQQMLQPELRYLAGVPKMFMHNSNMGAIQPIGYVNPAINPLSVMPREKSMLIQTDNPMSPQVYSPTDIYGDMQDSPDPDTQKRLSAFQRLGPIAHKKSRLTINLSLNEDQNITTRDVIEESDKYKPTHEKQNIIDSKDPTVVEYLPLWPWRQAVITRKTVTARNSKTVMMLEKEYMEETYDKDTVFILVSIEGYPENWNKEDVLDLILEYLKGKHFIPCFIEFTPKECKFFIIRSKGALSAIHSMGFVMHKDNIEVRITISQTLLTLKQVNFMPRIVLRSRLALTYDCESKLDLSEFTLKGDISHFIYFPLHRVVNQTELIHLQSTVSWQFITELDLSRNRLKSIEGFCLEKTTPRLKVLDLSHNCVESVLKLITCRELPLIKLTLDGNPLCHDYIESDHYVKVLKTMFSSLRELDGVEIVKDTLPRTIRNYCPEHSRDIVEKFLEVFFPLLECVQEERKVIHSLYADNAVMTVTHKNQLRYNTANKLVLNLLIKSRILLDGDFDHIKGRSNIVKLIKKWPHIQHDASTFTVDVVYSTDTSVIFTINGIFKITAETLAQNETLMSFTRTMTLVTENGIEYKILNEMLYFDEPNVEWEKKAFQRVMIPKKILGLKLEFPIDKEIKERLIRIFMKITSVDKKECESYLVEKNWNFKDALKLFTSR